MGVVEEVAAGWASLVEQASEEAERLERRAAAQLPGQAEAAGAEEVRRKTPV